MQSCDISAACSDCSGRLVDAGDELVCQECGVVREKQVIEVRQGPVRAPVAIDFTGQALGGYMGAVDVTNRDRFSKGFSHTRSKYEYLKMVSDYADREDGAVYTCARMIERVCEKLGLPTVVMSEAIHLAKKILSSEARKRSVTLATVSAYALIASCKIEGITSANVKDIVRAHQALGRRVKSSSLIQLSLDSPVRVPARGPEEYLGRVTARLASNPRLVKRISDEGDSPTSYFNSLRVVAKEILGSASWSSKVGRSPCSLAATAVYGAELLLATRARRGKRITQREVAACGDTAEYTVREQYREVFMKIRSASQPETGLLLPPPR